MPVTVMTDNEIDRAVSLRTSRSIPFPPEICLCDRYQARRFYDWITYYQAYGLDDHPLVQLLSRNMIESSVAASISRSATYLDRLNHYAAWLGTAQPVGVIDSRLATPDHPTGDEVAVGPASRTGTEQSPYQTGRGASQELASGTAVVRLPSRRSVSGGVDNAEVDD